ncbi:putrescine hydroxycinnamoyltransferase 1-like [Typha latifolia]|uniref:putrescine hydroxycinnamoyltransferase 1-like n=1 Tax=Typha latifolia TaxID=4733 RepID=UPI003C305F6F
MISEIKGEGKGEGEKGKSLVCLQVMEVKVLESSLVVPSEETPKHALWLSNLDLLVARSHTPTVYFYKPNGDPTFFSPETMKASLAKTLVYFYPLAGRLALDRTGRVEIQCTGEGVLFVVARSEATVEDLGEFVPSTETRMTFVPSVEAGNPILAMFQVTFFKCGGVCLGAAVHHTAADGLGALHFVNTWSDIARGAEVTVPPSVDRTILKARSPPSISFDHVEYHAQTPPQPKSPFDSTILKISKTQLNSLKTTKGGRPISTFAAVVAFVWKCACKARNPSNTQQTRLYFTADARTRVSPPLPAGYLGNGIFRASAAARVEDVLSESIQSNAERIRAVAARLNDEFIRSLVDYLEGVSDVKGLQKGNWALPGTDMWVINWQGLPIYEADFGWGKPVYMGRACLQFAGLVYIMHSPGEEGGLSLAVAFEPENLETLKRVFYEDLGGVEGVQN